MVTGLKHHLQRKVPGTRLSDVKGEKVTARPSLSI
jgi:hypothetical protein